MLGWSPRCPPQTAWVRVFSECCLGGAAPGPGLGSLPRKVQALFWSFNHEQNKKKSWFGLKITVRIPVKYWFMCSFRLRTSFLGWSIVLNLYYPFCWKSFELIITNVQNDIFLIFNFLFLKSSLFQHFFITPFDDRTADCVLCIRWQNQPFF